MINEDVKKNFETLKRAFKKGDVLLMECKRKHDNKIVNLLCAVQYCDDTYTISPFAEMIDGDPFEMYAPPCANGGFIETETAEN